MKPVNYWIDNLDLQPHPEGGYFKEVYRASETIPKDALPMRFTGERSFSTSIYYLLNQKDFSAFHRIKQDELWHFYEGSSLQIHVISSAGKYSCSQLGRNLLAGDKLQVVVKAGDWFAATVDDQQLYSLVGCTVAPGFDFADFEMAERESLIAQYPDHAELIRMLTR